LSLGGGLEANLGTYDLSSQSHTFTTQADFGDGDFFVFAASNASTATAVQTVVYDELRWGTSLGNVVAVPEPGPSARATGARASTTRALSPSVLAQRWRADAPP